MRRLILALLLTTVAGCQQGGDVSDLEQFTAEAFEGYKPQVEPLPALQPQAVFIYTASGLTDPFDVDNLVEKAEPLPVEGGEEGPDRSRRKEPLELFPIDGLKMVGLLEQDGENWAVVRASDGSVHRVKTGNYAGQNYGEIVAVNENSVDIIELVKNPVGRWEKRDASLLLVE